MRELRRYRRRQHIGERLSVMSSRVEHAFVLDKLCELWSPPHRTPFTICHSSSAPTFLVYRVDLPPSGNVKHVRPGASRNVNIKGDWLAVLPLLMKTHLSEMDVRVREN